MWKTQLTLALKTFLEDRNGLLGGRGPRMSFEKFVDELFNGVRRLVRDE